MDTEITNKIIEFIGEDLIVNPSENMEKYIAYNESLKAMRRKAPSIAKSIVDMVVGRISEIPRSEIQMCIAQESPVIVRNFFISKVKQD